MSIHLLNRKYKKKKKLILKLLKSLGILFRLEINLIPFTQSTLFLKIKIQNKNILRKSSILLADMQEVISLKFFGERNKDKTRFS